MDRVQMKLAAKEDLRNTKGYLTVSVIYFIIAVVASVILGVAETRTNMSQAVELSTAGYTLMWVLTAVSLVVTFAFMLLAYGFLVYFLKVSRRQMPESKELFAGFSSNWMKVLAVNIMVGVFTFLWSLLLIVPGIIKACGYSMSNYILADNPDMQYMEVIKKSTQMMNGHKKDYFVLGLSFIPWILLTAVTLGIASIWVAPYIQTTTAHFYENIKNSTAE